MKQYCLKDIRWIYSRDGMFVTPFIFNHNLTKIRDLESDTIIELDTIKNSPIDAVRKYYLNMLHINNDVLFIDEFWGLVINGRLQLKGIKNLKFAKLKQDLFKNDTSNYKTFIVDEYDIKNITRELIHQLNPKIELEKSVDSVHYTTSNF